MHPAAMTLCLTDKRGAADAFHPRGASATERARWQGKARRRPASTILIVHAGAHGATTVIAKRIAASLTAAGSDAVARPGTPPRISLGMDGVMDGTVERGPEGTLL